MRARRRVWVAGAAVSALLASCGPSVHSNDSGPGTPTSITTGPTSHVHVIQATRTGLILTDQEGLWHGTKAGTDWRPTGPPLNHLMATCLVQVKGTTLACTTTYASSFLGTPRGVWRTTDGSRWNRAALPDLSVLYLAVNSNVPGVVVAYARPDSTKGGVGHGGIWVSVNSGKSWRRVNTSLADSIIPIGLALLPGKPFTIVYAQASGLSISRDGGRTWTMRRFGGETILAITTSRADPNVLFVSGALVTTGKGAIWRGDDEGLTWTKLWDVPPASLLTTASSSIDDVYGYVNIGNGKLFHATVSQLGGYTEPRVENLTVPAESDQMQLSVDPSNSLDVYSAWSFPLKLYRSLDGGKTWRKLL